MFTLDFLRRFSLMGTTLRAAPSKSYAFSTNDHAYIAMPTWCRCSPPILFWHWPPFNLFPSSCITWIFFVDSHWWVPLCVQRPTISIPFRQIIMYIYFVLTSINLICSCFVHVQQHAPARIAGAGYPCSDRSLFEISNAYMYGNSFMLYPEQIIILNCAALGTQNITDTCIKLLTSNWSLMLNW